MEETRLVRGHDCHLPEVKESAIYGSDCRQRSLDTTNSELSGDLALRSDECGCARSPALGYGLRMIGTLLIIAGTSSVQMLNRTLPHSELNGLRFTGSLAIVAPLVVFSSKYKLPNKSVGYACLHVVLSVVIAYAHNGACYYLPLGLVACLMDGLILTFSLLSSALIRRAISWLELTAVILCIVGVFLCVQPTAIFGNHLGAAIILNRTRSSPCGLEEASNLTLPTHSSVTQEKQHMVGYVLILVSSALCVVVTSLEYTVLREVSVLALFLYLSLFAICVSFSLMAVFETPRLPTVSVCLLLLLVHMMSSGSHALLNTAAGQLISPVPCALITSLEIPLLVLLQYSGLPGILPGHANVLELVGAGLVFTGNVLIPLRALLTAGKTHKDAES